MLEAWAVEFRLGDSRKLARVRVLPRLPSPPNPDALAERATFRTQRRRCSPELQFLPHPLDSL